MANTFRWDPVMSALWAGDRSYPATFHRESVQDHIPDDFKASYPTYRMETRQATVHFENQWQLSTIWGDATYSSNHWLDETGPFIEEPTLVEVGVLVPEPIAHETRTIELPDGPRDLPGYESHLWGDPLGYVDVPMYQRVAWLVMHLPTEIDLPEGEWDDAQGFCDLLITAGLERTFDDH